MTCKCNVGTNFDFRLTHTHVRHYIFPRRRTTIVDIRTGVWCNCSVADSCSDGTVTQLKGTQLDELIWQLQEAKLTTWHTCNGQIVVNFASYSSQEAPPRELHAVELVQLEVLKSCFDTLCGAVGSQKSWKNDLGRWPLETLNFAAKWVTHFVQVFVLELQLVSRRFVAFMEFLFIKVGAFSRFAASSCWSPQPHMFVLQAFGVRYLEFFPNIVNSGESMRECMYPKVKVCDLRPG